jgi:hypothetical protein
MAARIVQEAAMQNAALLLSGSAPAARPVVAGCSTALLA